ncbi:hypothetical protein Tcan_03507 [Toxocara canis]|uniref:Secreted protein n=1 Tax=Toxocara canis TaxID=6265 RepID=A0A0B2VIF5_TOXCA|nr:hypothetical protein Tcan_03507 [Toxocara canis]
MCVLLISGLLISAAVIISYQASLTMQLVMHTQIVAGNMKQKCDQTQEERLTIHVGLKTALELSYFAALNTSCLHKNNTPKKSRTSSSIE